ncbi:glycosyltransferase family 4 protein [Enterovirga rhinocerotis]|uniref:glycosyltransferase family 4 protein n=1 Tax=Enterovirga rhinocerotis TaxID=1339210 RepID=UPI0010612776|nr:glycosyltransferase family 4 protein [Enterovirga rhinocerotis]
MHVVIILDHAYINGGQANVALASALGLKARGHEVTVFAAVGPVDQRLTEAGIDVVCLGQDDVNSQKNPLAFAVQVIWNAPARRALDKLLATLDPARSIVHVHGWAKALSPSIGRALKAHPALPIAYTMHEFFLVCPNGGFYDYPAETVCHRTPMSLACITRNCDSRNYPRKVLRLVRHAALDHLSGLPEACRHVITISDLQVEVAGPYFRPGTSFYRVDNPIDVPDLGPKTDPASGGFLFVGRLSPEKGAALFAQAADQAGIPATFVGDGPSGDELRTRYPGATFLGWKSPAEVRMLMREARALVFPSVWYEGQPLTVLESLAVGTPVIVSDVCAGRESVVDGETGLWFRTSDVGDLARCLTTLSDDALVARMSRAAYDRYWARPLTLDAHLDRLEEVYAQIAHLQAPALQASVMSDAPTRLAAGSRS